MYHMRRLKQEELGRTRAQKNQDVTSCTEMQNEKEKGREEEIYIGILNEPLKNANLLKVCVNFETDAEILNCHRDSPVTSLNTRLNNLRVLG